jgi:hypothetical protein
VEDVRYTLLLHHYYIGLRAAGGKRPRAALRASNVTRSYASKGFLRHVW